ncbi:MAG: hypothetical protein IKQ93_04940 [Candidatus Methanomethylophilaceae archaeon]|nr:hypothetical protein [Candidatus Methanomethylophilaceae archaeon]
MESRRISLIATIALILVLAIGIGFAYAAYTANNGNNTEVAYVTLTQVGDETPYTFADNVTVKLDTYNKDNAQKIYYRLSGFNIVKGTNPSYGTYKCGLLGTIELHADFTGTNVTPPQTLDISISGSSGFDATATWKYFITDAPDPSTGMTSKIYAMKDSAKAVSEWTQGMDSLTMTHGQSGYQNVKLYVYYGYAADAETLVDGMMFLNSTEAPKKLMNASLMIKATSDNDSNLVTYKANNGTTETDFMVSTAANQQYTLVTDPTKI